MALILSLASAASSRVLTILPGEPMTTESIDGQARLDALMNMDYEHMATRAERGELRVTPGTVRQGKAAAASGRAMLEAAGYDVDALEERLAKGGRPRLDGQPTGVGERSPRLNVSIPADLNAQVTERANATGATRSDIVRDALTAYLAS